ncbi:MAG: hypothetical protein LBJ18_02335 [Rickettsiales bacterium]|jgi:hypothetical protein|nr:hypothetical protein [Rickettsiales bacterium]
MLGKIKRIFFNGIFGILYVSFAAQLIYVLTLLRTDINQAFGFLGLLSIEWLVLVGARYLSKKSSGAAQSGGYRGGYNRH